MGNKKAVRKLHLENLEQRSLLAGNVTASVTDGVLTIMGDAADNKLYIRQLDPTGPTDPWPGARYEIADLYPRGKPVTTINGESSFIVEGVKNGIYINLGDGNDFLNISRPGAARNAAAVPGKLAIDMAGGRDTLRLYVVNHRQVIARLGTSDDSVSLVGEVNHVSILTDGQWASAPSGRDNVQLGNLSVSGSASIETGGGNDEVRIAGVVFEGPLTVATGDGDDRINAWMTTTDSSAAVEIDTGNGQDGVGLGDLFEQTNLNSQVRVFTQLGNDIVQINNVISTSHIVINTGKGEDSLALANASLDSILAWMGEDADRLFVDEEFSSATTDFGGGAGTDTLDINANRNNDLGDATVTGFETGSGL